MGQPPHSPQQRQPLALRAQAPVSEVTCRKLEWDSRRRCPGGQPLQSRMEWRASQLPAAHVPPEWPPHLDISFLSPILPWFETKHINTFRQLDCTNLGVLCVYLPLPHAITSPHICGRRSSPAPQEPIPASTLKKSEPHE